jgi:hypothetical protein
MFPDIIFCVHWSQVYLLHLSRLMKVVVVVIERIVGLVRDRVMAV